MLGCNFQQYSETPFKHHQKSSFSPKFPQSFKENLNKLETLINHNFSWFQACPIQRDYLFVVILLHLVIGWNSNPVAFIHNYMHLLLGPGLWTFQLETKSIMVFLHFLHRLSFHISLPNNSLIINQSISSSINQSTNLSINQLTKTLINQSIN